MWRRFRQGFRLRDDFGGARLPASGAERLECFYGENAWQTPAALVQAATEYRLALGRFELLEGVALSYNNLLEPDRQLQTITHIAAALDLAAEAQARDLVVAWAIGSTINSNTITLVRDGQLLGNGVGQQDRVGGCALAISRATNAGHRIDGCVAYSDSYFPFPDGPQLLIDAGVSAVFCTTGSVRDGLVRPTFRLASPSSSCPITLPAASSATSSTGHDGQWHRRQPAPRAEPHRREGSWAAGASRASATATAAWVTFSSET